MGDQKPAAGGCSDPYFIFHISSYLNIFPKTPLDCEKLFFNISGERLDREFAERTEGEGCGGFGVAFVLSRNIMV